MTSMGAHAWHLRAAGVGAAGVGHRDRALHVGQPALELVRDAAVRGARHGLA